MERSILSNLSEQEQVKLCQEKFREQQGVMQALWPDEYVAMIMGVVVGHHADIGILTERAYAFYSHKPIFFENVNCDDTNPEDDSVVTSVLGIV